MADWFVRDESGSTTGPYSEAHVREGLESNAITGEMFVRQQNSDWLPAEQVRVLFRRLMLEGFFIRDRAGKVFGPFTKQRVLEMDRASQLPGHYWIKQGKQPRWTEIRTTLSTPPVAATPRKAADTSRQDASSGERLRHEENVAFAKPVIPAAPVMKLRNNSLIDRLVHLTERVEDTLFGSPLPNG